MNKANNYYSTDVLNHNGFTGNAELLYKDNCWHGKITNITDLVTYEAESYEDLKEELVIAVEDYQETLRKLNISSGIDRANQFMKRINRL